MLLSLKIAIFLLKMTLWLYMILFCQHLRQWFYAFLIIKKGLPKHFAIQYSLEVE